MSLLEDISLPRFWDRFLLKMFLRHVCCTRFWNTVLDQDSGTHLLHRFLGHVFWTAETEKVTNFEQNRNHTIRNHIDNTTTRTPPQRKHGRNIHCHLLLRILALTHLFRLTSSPNLYSVFACLFVGCILPKVYLPTRCYWEQQPCLVFTLRITIMFYVEAFCLGSLVVSSWIASFVSLCLPCCSTRFPVGVLNARCFLVQIQKVCYIQ